MPHLDNPLRYQDIIAERERRVADQLEQTAALRDVQSEVGRRSDSVEDFLRENILGPLAPHLATAWQAVPAGVKPPLEWLGARLGEYVHYVSDPLAETVTRGLADIPSAPFDVAAGRGLFPRTREFTGRVGEKLGAASLPEAAAQTAGELRWSRETYFPGERVLGSLILDPLNFVPAGGAMTRVGRAAVYGIGASTARKVLATTVEPKPGFWKRLSQPWRLTTPTHQAEIRWAGERTENLLTGYTTQLLEEGNATGAALLDRVTRFRDAKLGIDYMRGAPKEALDEFRTLQRLLGDVKDLPALVDAAEDVRSAHLKIVRAVQNAQELKLGVRSVRYTVETLTDSPKQFSLPWARRALGEKKVWSPLTYSDEEMAAHVAKLKQASPEAAPLWEKAVTGNSEALLELEKRGFRVTQQVVKERPNIFFRINAGVKATLTPLWLSWNIPYHVSNWATNMVAVGLETGFPNMARTISGDFRTFVADGARLMAHTWWPRATEAELVARIDAPLRVSRGIPSFAERNGLLSGVTQQEFAPIAFGSALENIREPIRTMDAALGVAPTPTLLQSIVQQLERPTRLAGVGLFEQVGRKLPAVGPIIERALAAPRALAGGLERGGKVAIYNSVIREMLPRNLIDRFNAHGITDATEQLAYVRLALTQDLKTLVGKAASGAYDAFDALPISAAESPVQVMAHETLSAIAIPLREKRGVPLRVADIEASIEEAKSVLRGRAAVAGKALRTGGDDLADELAEAQATAVKTVTERSDFDAAVANKLAQQIGDGLNPVQQRQRQMQRDVYQFTNDMLAAADPDPLRAAIAHAKVEERQAMYLLLQAKHQVLQDGFVAELKLLTETGHADEIAHAVQAYRSKTIQLFMGHVKEYSAFDEAALAAVRGASPKAPRVAPGGVPAAAPGTAQAVGGRWRGPAYRAESGFRQDPGTTAGDVVRYETDVLGNDLGVDPTHLPFLDTLAAPRIVWVTKSKRGARHYGKDVDRVELGENATIIGLDGEGGYLVSLDTPPGAGAARGIDLDTPHDVAQAAARAAPEGWAFKTPKVLVSRLVREAGLPPTVDPASPISARQMVLEAYDEAAKYLDSLKGKLAESTAGMPADARKLDSIRKAVEEARLLTVQQGTVRAESAMFNYGINTYLDYAAQHFAPFPFWSTRTMISYFLRVGLNPVQLARALRVTRAWYEESKNQPRSAWMTERLTTLDDGTQVRVRPWSLFFPMGQPVLELVRAADDPQAAVELRDILELVRRAAGMNPYPYIEWFMGYTLGGQEVSGYGLFRTPQQTLRDLVPQQRYLRNIAMQIPGGPKLLAENPLRAFTELTQTDQNRAIYTIRDAVSRGELRPDVAEATVASLAVGRPTELAYHYIGRSAGVESNRLFGTVSPAGIPIPGAFFGTGLLSVRKSQKEARDLFEKFFAVDEGGVPKLTDLEKQKMREENPHLFVGQRYLPPTRLPPEGLLFQEWKQTADYWYQVEQLTQERTFTQLQLDEQYSGRAWTQVRQALSDQIRARRQELHDPTHPERSAFPLAKVTDDERGDFLKRLGKLARPEHPLDVAYQKYVEILTDPAYTDPVTHEPDYIRLDVALDAHKATLGEGTLRYIKQRLTRDRTDKEKEYFEAREVTRPYWEAWKTLPAGLQEMYLHYLEIRRKDYNQAVALASRNGYVKAALRMIERRRQYLARSDKAIAFALAEFWSSGPQAAAERRLMSFEDSAPTGGALTSLQ